METLCKERWTVEQERQLYEEESATDLNASAVLNLLQSNNEFTIQSMRDLSLDFKKYSLRKLVKKLNKIKSVAVYDILYFFSFANQEDLISSSILNCISNKSSAFFLSRNKSVLPLSKKFVHTLAFALS